MKTYYEKVKAVRPSVRIRVLPSLPFTLITAVHNKRKRNWSRMWHLTMSLQFVYNIFQRIINNYAYYLGGLLKQSSST